MRECPPGFTQRWILEQSSAKVAQRPEVLRLLHGAPTYDPLECVRIPPLVSTSGIDLGPVGEMALQIGLRAFDVGTFGLSSPLTSPVISQSRTEDRPLAPSQIQTLKSQEVPMPNGFGDIFGDIGAFFTTEQTFGETLSNVGADIWGGFTSALPSFPTLAQSFLPGLPRSGQPARGAAPRPPSLPELFLPEFLRPSQQTIAPTPLAAPPGRGGWPAGSWESDTYGEPFTFPAPQGGMAMAAGEVMLPAVRGMGTLALQATVNAMRSQGMRATVSWLAGVIRKFGPAAAAGFLASWVADEIATRAVFEAYAHKRRRMNPANVKALRRSLRRITAFNHLCRRVESCMPKRYKKVCR